MLITYFRSSSYNRWSFCQQLYFIEYNLGWFSLSGLAADKGTIVHKVMEIIAKASQAKAEGKKTFTDEIMGRMSSSRYDINDIIQKVYDYYSTHLKHHNWSSRDFADCKNWAWAFLTYDGGQFDPRNRKIVKPELPFDFEIDKPWATYTHNGEKRQLALKGTIDLVTELDDGIYEAIDWKGLPTDTPIPTPDGWSNMGNLSVGDEVFDKDGNITQVLAKSRKKIKECYQLEFNNTIVAECDCDHLWLLSGGDVVNVLDLKIGDTIDVVKPSDEIVLPSWRQPNSVHTITNIKHIGKKETQCIMVDSPSNTYLCTRNMIPTHNTGRCIDWANSKEKTFATLHDDPQLRLYHYAIHHVYPHLEQVVMTIFYLKDVDGKMDPKPFSICFTKDDLEGTEEIIHKRFNTITRNTRPRLNKSWKCKSFCGAGKTTFEGTSIEPMMEFRDGQVTPKGEIMSKCEQVKFSLEKDGFTKTCAEYGCPGFEIDSYRDPGSVT